MHTKTLWRAFFAAFALLLALPATGQEKKTFCNPLDLVVPGERSYRGGEPVVLVYQDDYYLFVSHRKGYWYSPDFKDWTWRDALPLAIGAGIGVALCLVQQPDQNHPNTALWYTGLSGALAVCSMILPGIAGSFILVMMGNFTFMLEVLNGTVSHLLGGDGVAQWGQLLVFVLGCVVGIVAFSKALNALLEKHGRPTMLVLFGFVLGFLVAIWPWTDKVSIAAAQLLRAGDAAGAEAIKLAGSVPAGLAIDPQIPLALFAFIVGGAVVAAIEIPSKKNA